MQPLCWGHKLQTEKTKNWFKSQNIKNGSLGKKRADCLQKWYFCLLCSNSIISVPKNHLRPNLQNGDRRAATSVQLQYVGVTISTNWMGAYNPKAIFSSQSKIVITFASKTLLTELAQRVFQNDYVALLKLFRNSGKHLGPLRVSRLMPVFSSGFIRVI